MSLQQICYQCDYGDREKLREPIRDLVTKYSPQDLAVIPFVNNNPYQFEFYLIIEFEIESIEGYIRKNIESLCIKKLSSVSLNYLVKNMGERRFNNINHIFPELVDEFFNNFFFFPERKTLKKEGYKTATKLFPPNTVFFSYSSDEKEKIQTLHTHLIPYNLPIFFDMDNIETGANISNTIELAIEECKGVIFFVNQKYINSSWCQKEEKLSQKFGKKSIYIIDTNLSNNVINNKYSSFLYVKQDFNNIDYKYLAKKILEVFNV
jgi:hypothetical protein